MHSQCSDANTLIEEVLAATFADPKDGELIKQMTDFLAYNFVTVFWYHTRKHCIFENMNRPLFGSIQLGWSQSSIPCIAQSDQSPYWGSQWSCLQRRLHLREHFLIDVYWEEVTNIWVEVDNDSGVLRKRTLYSVGCSSVWNQSSILHMFNSVLPKSILRQWSTSTSHRGLWRMLDCNLVILFILVITHKLWHC